MRNHGRTNGKMRAACLAALATIAFPYLGAGRAKAADTNVVAVFAAASTTDALTEIGDSFAALL